MTRPLSVTIVSWIYIAVGAVSFAYGFPRHSIHADDFLAECVRLSGIVAGAFMLRGENWARWLALAWIVFHVGLSAFHLLGELAVHSGFCIVIAFILFRRDASRYFRDSPGRRTTTKRNRQPPSRVFQFRGERVAGTAGRAVALGNPGAITTRWQQYNVRWRLEMRIDWYTKGVLTVIAVLLGVIALRPYVSPDAVQAQGPFAGVEYGSYPGYPRTFFDPRTGDIWEYHDERQIDHYRLTKLGVPLVKVK